jgi:uncharacterized pyridoxal phosphate-containing UPF0001 family protein
VREACAAGQRAFGENYVQEALDKMAALAELPLEWHLVGPLQSNKTRAVAERFDWVHTVEREKVARRLSEQRRRACAARGAGAGERLGRGLQGQRRAERAPALARAVAALPRLRLRGWRCRPTPDAQLQRARFRELRGIESLQRGPSLNTLPWA